MSSNKSSEDKNLKHESEFLEFLLTRIGRAGGSLQLQHITGHMSQLSYDTRCSVASSLSDLMEFLKKHKSIFNVHNGYVRIINSSVKDESCDSDGNSTEHKSLPPIITKGKGVIIKIFPQFGFIRTKEPIKTEVWFKDFSLGEKNIDLTSILSVGTMVYFNAKRKTANESRSKYTATKVWKVDVKDIHSGIIPQKVRKIKSTQLYDPITLDSEGIIQKVFPNLGFIAVKGDENNTVFFYKNRLLKYDNIVDLTKVLSKGDLVEFSAHRSTKQDAKARWEATKVWKKSGKIQDDYNVTKSDSGISSDSFALKFNPESINKTKEMIKNQRGKICPRSQGAVIKFGQNELADGDASIYYISGSQVTDISWEFSEGEDVFFDAVKIKSAPGWKAVLVWTGEKPDIVLPTCLGDFSEFTDEETEDNYSSCISYSSNSSMKSESSSSKIRNPQLEKSVKLSNSMTKKDVKKSNKMDNCIGDLSSRCNSQNSLSSSVTSKSSQKSSKEHKKKTSINAENKSAPDWGDSLYPADESYQNMSSYENNEFDLDQKISKHEIEQTLYEEVCNKSGCFTSDDEETAKAEANVNELPCSPLKVKDEKEIISEAKNSSKEANIKKYNCMIGRIIKVYSKFAEVYSSKLQNTVSFFWNNYYFKGVSVEELELSDLKQVLKVGDYINFNYFEIVDDSGQNWQKVSLAWNHSKPKKANEISPEDFIKQNNLLVSTKNEIIIDDMEEKIVSRKFLTAVEDEIQDKQVDEVSKTESCSDDELLIAENLSELSKQPNRPLSPVDYSNTLIAVTEILKKDLFPQNSKIDLNSISEEIIKVILRNETEEKFDDNFCSKPVLQYDNITSDTSCTSCGKTYNLNSSSNLITKNSETQTIVTGDIIAQNIFTEC